MGIVCGVWVLLVFVKVSKLSRRQAIEDLVSARATHVQPRGGDWVVPESSMVFQTALL